MTATATRPEAEDDSGTEIKSGLRRMMSEQEVLAAIPISRTTLFRLMKAGKFPRAVYVSANRRIWFERDVANWQAAIEAVDEFNPNRGRGKGRRRRA
jgi:predicted DNA-binding transcriptional regulator AlpA